MWISAKQEVEHFLLELLFPSFCLGCKKEGTFLCHDCRATLDIAEYNYCLCNKNPTRLVLAAGRPKGKCSRCNDKKLAGLYFALPYQEKLLTRKLIYQCKYPPYIKSLAPTLASLIIEHLVLTKQNTESIWQNTVLIPVPLEKKKLKSRGYNQAEELAKELAKVLQVPVVSDVLVKTKSTLPQMKLSAAERQENLIGAFAIKNALDIKCKKIFLVDDVYTTGSTMEECARVLKESGAKSVW